MAKKTYNHLTQKKYEALMDRMAKGVVKKTERMAAARNQSGVPDEPGDAKPMTPTGVSGEKELLAENKKKEKTDE
jgi:hypothetical protein